MALSQFAQDLLKTIPEDTRGAVQQALEAAPEADKLLTDGAKRQSEFSRSMDQLREQQTALKTREQELGTHLESVKAKAEEQATWYEANKAALAAGWKVINEDGTEGEGDPNGKPNPPKTPSLPPDLVRKADVEKLINEREAGAARFITVVNRIAFKHFQEHGEVLDTDALLSRPEVQQYGLEEGYRRVHADKIEAKAKAAYDAKVEQDVQERLTAERRKGFNPGYPSGPDGPGSPLDSLVPADPTKAGQVDEAVAEYHRLVSANHGAPST